MRAPLSNYGINRDNQHYTTTQTPKEISHQQQDVGNLLSGGTKTTSSNPFTNLSTTEVESNSLSTINDIDLQQAGQQNRNNTESSNSIGEKQAAEEQLNGAQLQLDSVNQMTTQGNAEIEADITAMDEAENLAREAESLSSESSDLQKDELKKLKTSNQQQIEND